MAEFERGIIVERTNASSKAAVCWIGDHKEFRLYELLPLRITCFSVGRDAQDRWQHASRKVR